MKKQFAIKSVNVSKVIASVVAKKESNNSLGSLWLSDSVCCSGFQPQFVGLKPKTSFSL
ncbi:hypothetical protein [Spirosoma agri]|uniref:Uncharacterized protein n=1 Tax=Spirosoma agri TaxID=1987381 RepID=A0A6M0IL45_9BACT|nr:hypothetical protein [Spirosoma agri]NEU69009.1 hypothetical protein [Spirosoma agri]